MRSNRCRRTLLAVTLLSVLALPALAANSNKWRIQCSEGAKSSGEITFRFEFGDAADFDISVPIPKGTSENGVARTIRDTFRQKLDAKRFHIEVDDGEDVLVKAKGGQKDFTITLAGNTVKAVRIVLDRE